MRAPSVGDGARPPVVVSKGCRGWWGCRCERRAEGCVRATRSASAPPRSLAMQAACVGESDRPLLFPSPPTGQPLASQSASSSPTAKRGTLGFSMLHFCFSEKGPRVPHLHPDPSAVHGVWARELPEGPLSIPESCSALRGRPPHPPAQHPPTSLPASQLLRCPLPPCILSPASRIQALISMSKQSSASPHTQYPRISPQSAPCYLEPS